VLVIIGLIAGGVLVGQDLIRAAGVRAQISQIEKYNTAVNTFRGKYDALPGDMNKTTAAQFGFVARSGIPGDGDGNGLIAGTNGGNAFGTYQNSESLYLWADLSQAGLIEGSFTVPAFPGGGAGTLTANSTPNYNAFFPPAKLGQSWIMAYSMGGNNYFTLGGGAGGVQPNGPAFGTPAQLTVQQAYSIDAKTDDGLPQAGRVTTQAILWNTITQWAAGGSNPPATGWGANPGTAAGASSTTCYDNGGNASNPMQYSMTRNNGAGVNCALSFQLQ
jgi:hypothetical protein